MTMRTAACMGQKKTFRSTPALSHVVYALLLPQVGILRLALYTHREGSQSRCRHSKLPAAPSCFWHPASDNLPHALTAWPHHLHCMPLLVLHVRPKLLALTFAA